MTKDEALKKAFKQAFQLGQDYWYQADHEYESQNKKSDVTRAKFEQLMEDAIKEALAQPEQGWTPERIAGMARLKETQDKKLAQRTWVGLTDEDKEEIKKQANYHWEMTTGEYAQIVQNLTEVKLKQKNEQQTK